MVSLGTAAGVKPGMGNSVGTRGACSRYTFVGAQPDAIRLPPPPPPMPQSCDIAGSWVQESSGDTFGPLAEDKAAGASSHAHRPLFPLRPALLYIHGIPVGKEGPTGKGFLRPWLGTFEWGHNPKYATEGWTSLNGTVQGTRLALSYYRTYDVVKKRTMPTQVSHRRRSPLPGPMRIALHVY